MALDEQCNMKKNGIGNVNKVTESINSQTFAEEMELSIVMHSLNQILVAVAKMNSKTIIYSLKLLK